jgi:membrane-anchored protein YejM (alkaline phosphatase superfamily)
MNDDRHRLLLSVGYWIAAMLIVIPLIEGAVQAWPLTPSAIHWRYGLVGYFANNLPLPLLGWGIAVATATVLKHHVVLRTVIVLSWIGGIVILATSGIFAIDAIQLRNTVNPEIRASFDAASFKAMLALGFALVALLWLGFGGWMASRSSFSRRRRNRSGGGAVVVPTSRSKKPGTETGLT